MSMEVSVLQLGMIGTNCYIIKDDVTGKGCVIDPGDQPDRVIDAVKKSGMELAFWLNQLSCATLYRDEL